jgi:hypothetical protein
MSATLYLLRQQPEHISPSLFVGRDIEQDIVFIEQGASGNHSSLVVRECEKAMVSDSSHRLTYDELIEKIFSSVHVIVI